MKNIAVLFVIALLTIVLSAGAAAADTPKRQHCPCTQPSDCICAPGSCQCPACAAKAKAKVAVPAAGCTCGCTKTGKCTCANCDAGNQHAYPHCICGCTETGKCDCPDCDHPKTASLVKQRKREIVKPHVGMRYRHPDNGRWYTYRSDGYWWPDTDTEAAPVQYQRPVIVPRLFTNFGGGCSS